MPIPNGYHRFTFSDGFTALPVTASRFRPSSGNVMTLFTPSVTPSGLIGTGPLGDSPCFRFDFQGLSIGCGNGEACRIVVTGVQWNGTHNEDAGTRYWQVEACGDTRTGCRLQALKISTEQSKSTAFNNLTAIKIRAEMDSVAVSWAADNIMMSWTDNTCDAAQCRSMVRNSVMGWRRATSPLEKARRLMHSAARAAGVAGI